MYPPCPGLLASGLTIAKDILTISAYIGGAIFAFFVFRQLSPSLDLKIIPMRNLPDKQMLLLRSVIENRSRVRIYKKRIRIQILEYDLGVISSISEWVPFSKADIRPNEIPRQWTEPIEICETTAYINPGSKVVVERLFNVDNMGKTVLHIGIQFEAIISPRLKRLLKWEERWTHTVFFSLDA